MKEKLLILKYSEIALKKNNRKFFENILISNIHRRLSNFDYSLDVKFGRIYISYHDDKIIDILKNTFGLIGVAPCIKTKLDLNLLKENIINEIKKYRNKQKTFKVIVKRTNKNFKYDSYQIARIIGSSVLKNIDNIKVDVKNPELEIHIEVRSSFYMYFHTFKAVGGLPYGSSGSSLVLLSGGIDSPVAAYKMAKRGVKISAIHFHSYPFTSKESIDKIYSLKSKLENYTRNIKLYTANILEAQKILKKNTDERYFTVLQRRLMTRVANRIAKRKGILSITTGENISQVASQTIEAINCTNEISNIPIFRPLITDDKNDIINISKSIDCYDISILPFEDCCTVFLPNKVTTRPKLGQIIYQESLVNIEELVELTLNTIEM